MFIYKSNNFQWTIFWISFTYMLYILTSHEKCDSDTKMTYTRKGEDFAFCDKWQYGQIDIDFYRLSTSIYLYLFSLDVTIFAMSRLLVVSTPDYIWLLYVYARLGNILEIDIISDRITVFVKKVIVILWTKSYLARFRQY